MRKSYLRMMALRCDSLTHILSIPYLVLFILEVNYSQPSITYILWNSIMFSIVYESLYA